MAESWMIPLYHDSDGYLSAAIKIAFFHVLLGELARTTDVRIALVCVYVNWKILQAFSISETRRRKDRKKVTQ